MEEPLLAGRGATGELHITNLMTGEAYTRGMDGEAGVSPISMSWRSNVLMNTSNSPESILTALSYYT